MEVENNRRHSIGVMPRLVKVNLTFQGGEMKAKYSESLSMVVEKMKMTKTKIKNGIDITTMVISNFFIIMCVLYVTALFLTAHLSGRFEARAYTNLFGESHIELAMILIFWACFIYHYSGQFKKLMGNLRRRELNETEGKGVSTIFVFMNVFTVSIFTIWHITIWWS